MDVHEKGFMSQHFLKMNEYKMQIRICRMTKDGVSFIHNLVGPGWEGTNGSICGSLPQGQHPQYLRKTLLLSAKTLLVINILSPNYPWQQTRLRDENQRTLHHYSRLVNFQAYWAVAQAPKLMNVVSGPKKTCCIEWNQNRLKDAKTCTWHYKN